MAGTKFVGYSLEGDDGTVIVSVAPDGDICLFMEEEYRKEGKSEIYSTEARVWFPKELARALGEELIRLSE